MVDGFNRTRSFGFSPLMDNQTAMGSFRKVRNAYPLVTVGGVYDNQRALSSDKEYLFLRDPDLRVAALWCQCMVG